MKKAWKHILALLLAVSCTKVEVRTINDTFRISRRNNPESAETDELHLYAFRKDDGCLESVSNGYGDSISASLISGRKYSLYLLGNFTPEGETGSETEFIKRRVRLEEQDVRRPALFSHPLQYGGKGDNSSFHLKRYLSRISIGEIRCEWLEDISCELTMLAIVNAAGSIPLSGIPDDNDICFNRSGVDTDLPPGVKEKLVWEGSRDIGSNNDMGISLYCFPNSCDTDCYGAPWTPRRTRLAIRLSIGGEINWYPLNLPRMECNTNYKIDGIVIKGPGSLEPDMEIDRQSISFDIMIKPWSDETIDMDFQ